MPKERRTQLFSATMTSKVAKLQRACLDNPVKVEVDAKYRTVDTLRQQYLFIPAKHKVRGIAPSLLFPLPLPGPYTSDTLLGWSHAALICKAGVAQPHEVECKA